MKSKLYPKKQAKRWLLYLKHTKMAEKHNMHLVYSRCDRTLCVYQGKMLMMKKKRKQ